MPKRTNEFQQLVVLIQKALAPAGAKITESHLEETSADGEPREIDVLVEATVGPYKMRIAVESRDQGRKLDSSQFESIVGKYMLAGGVKVNQLVIVTHNGFYAPVIARAKELGIILMTLKEAESFDWTKIGPTTVPLKTGVRIGDIVFSPGIPGVTATQVLGGGVVSCSHGQVFGSLTDFAAFLFSKSFERNKKMFLELDEAASTRPDGRRGRVSWVADHPHLIRFRGTQYPMESISFDVHFATQNRRDSREARLQFQLKPHVCRVEVSPPVPGATIRELLRESRLVCAGCKRDHGTLGEWADKQIMKGQLGRKPEFLEKMNERIKADPRGEARITFALGLDKTRLGIQFRGTHYELHAVRVGVHAVSATAPVSCKQYEMLSSDGTERIVSHFEATAAGKKFKIVIPHVEGGHADKVVLNVSPADASSDDACGALPPPTLESEPSHLPKRSGPSSTTSERDKRKMS